MKPSEYKYTYRVEWSEEDSVYLAKCIEFPSLSAHGASPEEALKEARRAVRASLRWMTKSGENAPEPLGKRIFKGTLTLRVPPEVHRELAIRSAEQGVSINQYVLSRVAGS